MNENIAKQERILNGYRAKVAEGHPRASYYAKMVAGAERRLAAAKAAA